ncbi:MAG: hypothetical protein JF585_02925 [Burkholderiales bacterium]|nr:hypothetical protein [Burkholderiales bacterium]
MLTTSPMRRQAPPSAQASIDACSSISAQHCLPFINGMKVIFNITSDDDGPASWN